jgi:hypothetical protein
MFDLVIIGGCQIGRPRSVLCFLSDELFCLKQSLRVSFNNTASYLIVPLIVPY